MACPKMPTNPTVDDLSDAIECLQKEIADLEPAINNATSAANKFGGSIGESNNLLGDMKKKFVGINKASLEFVRSTGNQYKLAEELAEAYKKTSLQMGLSVGRSKQMAKEFKGAVAMVSRFGGEMGDVSEIYDKFADFSGRARILGADEVANIYKLGEATQLMGNRSADLFETLDLMGVSNQSAFESMSSLVVESQSIGLNSSKVMEVMSDNMSSMQSYSFKGGVKGMTEMAKQAVGMRIDVSSVLQMAEKFYQPEAAIEAAANLQMLGGDIAEAFGDPFETMYLARNKPEELAKKLQDMTENMMTFNEETKEYEFPAEVRMQLKAAGDQLGIDVGKMTEMARQTSKMKDVKMKLDMKGNLTDDKMIEGISNIAKMKDGKFVVDVLDKDGNRTSTAIEDLTKAQAEKALQVPKDEVDYMDKMLYNSQTTNKRLENIEAAFKFDFLEGIDVYQAIEGGTSKSIEAFGVELTEGVQEVFKNINQDDLLDGLAETFGMASFEKVDESMAKMISGFSELYKIDPSQDITIDAAGNVTVNTPNTSGGGVGNTTTEMSDEEKCVNAGHTWDGTNCKKANGDIYPLEKGGIVTKPINALIGEGKEAEAVMPLSDLKNFIGNVGSSSNNKHDVSGTITVNVNGADVSPDLKNLYAAAMMTQMIQKHSAGNGVENGGKPNQNIDYFQQNQIV
jgi:hypothetical protein